MERLTKKMEGQGGYQVEGKQIAAFGDSYGGIAVDKLARLENLYDDLKEKQVKISAEMEQLAAAGKKKSVKFRELLGRRLMNQNIIDLLGIYGGD